MVPVSCTVVTVPVTRLLIAANVRDLQAGEKPQLQPSVAMVDTAAPGEVVLVPLDKLAARRAQTPTLSAWLPQPDGSSGEGDDRVLWRQVASSAGGREMELVQAAETHTHTFRYAVAKDGAVTPLRSSVYDMSFMFLALGAGMVVAFFLRWLAIRARRRSPPPVPAVE